MTEDLQKNPSVMSNNRKQTLLTSLTGVGVALMLPWVCWLIVGVSNIGTWDFTDSVRFFLEGIPLAASTVFGILALITRIILGARPGTFSARTIFLIASVILLPALTGAYSLNPYTFCLPQSIGHGLLKCKQIQTTTSSFPGDVTVVTPSGLKTLDSIRVGDKVIGFDNKTQDRIVSTVEQVFSREADEFIVINNTLKTTPKHSFAITDAEDIVWKEAGRMSTGDCIFVTVKNCVEVRNISTLKNVPVTVYNIHVSDSENYFVTLGVDNVLVHNKTFVPPEIQARARAGRDLINEINNKYPGVHMESNNGFYSITIDGVGEDLHFPYFEGDQEEKRIPLNQIREAIEEALDQIPESSKAL